VQLLKKRATSVARFFADVQAMHELHNEQENDLDGIKDGRICRYIYDVNQ